MAAAAAAAVAVARLPLWLRCHRRCRQRVAASLAASAADVAEKILAPSLRRLYLGHLSRDCNRPELALKAVAGRLERLGGTHDQREGMRAFVEKRPAKFEGR